MNKSLADLISQVNDLAKEQGLLFTYDIRAAPKPKSPVPDNWEGLEFDEEYQLKEDEKGNAFPTYELVDAVESIGKLSKLMYRTWDNDGGWRPEEGIERYFIYFLYGDDNFAISCTRYSYKFLQFRTKKIAEDFLTKHRALIEQAAPILYGRVTE